MTMTLEMPATGMEILSSPPKVDRQKSRNADAAAKLLTAPDGNESTEPSETAETPDAGGCDVAIDQEPTSPSPEPEPASVPAPAAEQEPGGEPAAVTPISYWLNHANEHDATVVEPTRIVERAKIRADIRSIEEHLAAINDEIQELEDAAKNAKEQIKELRAEITSHVKRRRKLFVELEGGTVEQTETTPAAGSESADQPGATSALQPQVDAGTVPEDSASQPAPSATPTAPQADQAEQDRYRRVLEGGKIAELGLPQKIMEKLIGAGAETVWQLEQLRAAISTGRDDWPKGIGAAKVTQIEDAIMGWMGRHADSWAPSHRAAAADGRSAAEIHQDNQRIEDQQDADRAADVSESQPGASAEPQTPGTADETSDLLASL